MIFNIILIVIAYCLSGLLAQLLHVRKKEWAYDMWLLNILAGPFALLAIVLENYVPWDIFKKIDRWFSDYHQRHKDR